MRFRCVSLVFSVHSTADERGELNMRSLMIVLLCAVAAPAWAQTALVVEGTTG